MMRAGVFASEHDMHRRMFEVQQFPRGTGFPALTVPVADIHPVADVQAFSIDDITTTEIDDAFSVVFNPDGTARIGVHIAAPGLLFERNDSLDNIARDRLSTVYMPGDKITMLPDVLVEAATLAAGRCVAALSLYVTVDIASGQLIDEPVSRIESITVAHNLRHNLLDEVVNRDSLAAINPAEDLAEPPFVCARELALLWRVSQSLGQLRDTYRGKKENNQRVDYNFYVVDGRVEITPRRRDAPLDLLVAEFMILVNQHWGGLLHQQEVSGIYRIQLPGARVRMATHAAPHIGLGVPQYAWSTSPLRRYVDLVNQWQLIAVLKGDKPAFAHQDADLFAVVSAFDATYKAYADFQSRMERYWCLRWLQQQAIHEAQAVVIRDDIVRFADIPLVVRLPGFSGHARGVLLKLQIMEMDFISVDIHCRVLEVYQQMAQLADESSEDSSEDSSEPLPPADQPTPVQTEKTDDSGSPADAVA
jgi:exoribonuclease-2